VAPGRAPCIIGAAQRTWHPGGGDAPEPLEMWAEVAAGAAQDTGVADPGALLGRVETLDVLYCQTWPYDDPGGRLSARLGIAPRRTTYSGIGGTTPHLLLAEAADAVSAGRADLCLVVGGEALDTLRRAKREERRLQWSHRDPERKAFPFEAPFHPAEVAHEVFQAWLTFALFDLARRAHRGTAPSVHRDEIGRLLAPMTEVAAANPHAWFRRRRGPEELVEAMTDNRMVGYPYTKQTVAVMDVDMAAAILVASDDFADRMGVPPDQRVYRRGAAYAEDPVYVAEHTELWRSPAMASASAAALTAAGAGIDDVAHLDLYSCFASSLSFAVDALGLAPDDPRGLTVTGGLPFAGGPGSGYLLHSTASMTEVLRSDPGSLGLISGVGMHMTKHAFALWSTEPPASEPSTSIRGGPTPDTVPITNSYRGPATVATYSVVHGRDGAAQWGLVVADLPDGTRTYGRVEDPDLLVEAEEREWVGATIHLVAGEDGVNRVRS
jgi:acetyl-CoA C-acetyltransferase